MKQSMFYQLFLLLFHFTSSSIYFKIINEPGIHIWNIPKNENADPEYKRYNVLSNPNMGISKLICSHSNIPDSSSVKQSNKILETHNTYIILNIKKYKHFFLYYWIGAQSSEKKRRNVAKSAGFILKNQILAEIPEKNLKLFHREPEGAESGLFTVLFKLPASKKKPRLYRIAGSTGQFIMQVPLIYRELNGTDSYILEKYGEVSNWNSIHSNEYRRRQAKIFGERICDRNTNRQVCVSNFQLVTEGDPNIKKYIYNRVKTIFLKDMKDVPESRKFPKTPLNYTDEELAQERRDKLYLYEYFETSMIYVIEKRIVPWKVLRLDIFKENNAYVLVDQICGNITVFLGKNAGTQQIEESLSDAETFSKTTGVEDAWQQVKVLRQGQDLPIQFKIYFECET